MLKKLSFLLPALLVLNTFVAAMELPEQKKYSVACIDGSLKLNEQEINQFETLKNYLDIPKNGTFISLPEELNIAQSDIKTLLLDIDELKHYTQESLNNFYNDQASHVFKLFCIADFLAIDDAKFQILANELQKNAKSFGTLWEVENRSPNLKPSIEIKDIIKVQNTNIESLDGIEKFAFQQSFTDKLINIASLGYYRKPNYLFYSFDLRNNKLKNINLEKILTQFPGLSYIDLTNNKISKVKLPQKLPFQTCKVNLKDNPIDHGPLYSEASKLPKDLRTRLRIFKSENIQSLAKFVIPGTILTSCLAGGPFAIPSILRSYVLIKLLEKKENTADNKELLKICKIILGSSLLCTNALESTAYLRALCTGSLIATSFVCIDALTMNHYGPELHIFK